MTVPRHVTHSLDTMAEQLAKLRQAIGPAYTMLTLMTGDGYPSGGNSIGRSGTADPTLNAVLTKGRELDATIRIRLRVIAVGLEELAAIVDRLQPGKTPAELRQAYERVRCSGGGVRRGALEWGRPDCTNIADPHSTTGLCDACRLREYRWLQKQDAA